LFAIYAVEAEESGFKFSKIIATLVTIRQLYFLIDKPVDANVSQTATAIALWPGLIIQLARVDVHSNLFAMRQKHGIQENVCANALQ
jgi:hypothetical protein